MIRGIFFDLDRTLLDRDRSFADFAASQFEKFRPFLEGKLDQESYIAALVRLDARGSVWKDVVYQKLSSELSLSPATWEVLFTDFEARISHYYLPFPNLHATLAELSADFHLGLITNGKTDFQRRTLAALGIEKYFQVILISEKEGLRKPDPEIFHRALQQLGLLPHEAVYVGDHPLTDIQGARNAGMRGIWKRNPDFGEVLCDGVIDDLAGLPELIRRLSKAA